jgi:hypothetical protein
MLSVFLYLTDFNQNITLATYVITIRNIKCYKNYFRNFEAYSFSEHRDEAKLTGLLLSLLLQTWQNKLSIKTPIYISLHLNSTETVFLVTSS